MPYNIDASVILGHLKETSVIKQLIDRTNIYPKGVIEDVLIQMNEKIFLMYF